MDHKSNFKDVNFLLKKSMFLIFKTFRLLQERVRRPQDDNQMNISQNFQMRPVQNPNVYHNDTNPYQITQIVNDAPRKKHKKSRHHQRSSRPRHTRSSRHIHRSGHRSRSSISASELEFTSTDSGTEMASPEFSNRAKSLEVHSNRAFVESRSPSIHRSRNLPPEAIYAQPQKFQKGPENFQKMPEDPDRIVVAGRGSFGSRLNFHQRFPSHVRNFDLLWSQRFISLTVN